MHPFFCFLSALGVSAFISSSFGALPEGNAPSALNFPHFPDRQHAFVWRNWGLVEPARLAKVLGTSQDNVVALATSMGLPPRPAVEPEWRTRGYITVLRRNWHLLPYDQLLTLLDLPAERLEYLLREDDFLFVKLGNHKPRCDRLVYAPPDEKTSGRAAQIRRLVGDQFGGELAKAAEPRFAFLRRWSESVPDARPVGGSGTLRFIYSYAATFGDPLADGAPDPLPDGLLQELADRGVNGVWLHVVLRDLAPGGPDFPEFGAGHERRLANLRRLVERAARFGVGVYLYVNEPRAMTPGFFARRPDIAGVREGEHVAMCTSDARVRAWLAGSLTHVFREVPHLRGVFTITASENFTSCASHFNHKACPRCGPRGGAAVVAEVNRTIEVGVHRGNPDAKVIAWDWGWPDDWAGPVIDALPKGVSLQSVSEWSMPLNRGGVPTTIDEYCLSAPGPGPRATRHWALARRAGLKTSAKVQLNVTWELSAVPWLPVMELVAEHCDNLRSAGVDGMMLSWSLGGYPSPNLDVASLIASGKSREAALDAVARARYGDTGAPHARRAWKLFSDAFREYPYDGGVIYTCPVQFGPSNLLYATPTGYAATMIGFPYDDLARWRGPYPAEVFAAQFEKVSRGWAAGLAELEAAGHAEDVRLARAAGLHFRSVANQARFVLARDAKNRAAVSRVALDEMSAARELFPLARADSRVGFEPSNHYYYLPQDLVEKVINCKFILDSEAPPR
jgi:hypothetical protein